MNGIGTAIHYTVYSLLGIRLRLEMALKTLKKDDSKNNY